MKKSRKNGIDFFPVHVDFISSLPCRKLMKACGIQAGTVLMELLSRIYEYQGYFIACNEELVFSLADDLGTTEQEVISIIRKAVEYRIFDAEKFHQFGILTSQEIQQNFLFATKRRKDPQLEDKYLLSAKEENELSEEEASIQYVHKMYTEIEQSANDVYKTEHSLNSIDSNNSIDSLNTSSPNLKDSEGGGGEGGEKNEEFKKMKKNIPSSPSLQPPPPSPSWRTNFKTYLNQLGWAYKYLSEDPEYISQKEKFYPGIDVVSTLEKIIIEFWATERGWECQKKKPIDKIDWKMTFDKQMSHVYNQVVRN